MKRFFLLFAALTIMLFPKHFDISPQQFVNDLQKAFNQCGMSQSIRLDKSEKRRYTLTLDDYAKFKILYKDPQNIDSVYLEYSGKLGDTIYAARIINQTIPFIASLSQRSCKDINKDITYYNKIEKQVKETLKTKSFPVAELRMDGILMVFTKESDYSYSIAFIKEEK